MSPKNKNRLRRFTPVQRLFHMLLMLSFLIQAATGLGRMYIETPWGRGLTWVFGGYEGCRTVHIYNGILMVAGFLVHVIYLLMRVDWRNFPRSLAGPDSLIPRIGDVGDFFRHIGWFLGLNRAPQFERWGYWEKFDYWAVFWGIPILGITGLLMAYPLAASGIIPGWGLNVAFWIHRIEAILAMGHVFIVHFFVAHIRPHSFPMDRAMMEGSADLEGVRHERAAWMARLEQTGKLKELIIPEAEPARRLVIYLIGYAAVAVGVFLLIGGLVNSTRITW